MSIPTYTTPADEEFFAAIGRLTISWAQLESGIDLTVLMLHHNLNGRQFQREIPWTLSRKLRYIRKCFNGLKATHGKAFELLAPAIEKLTAEIEAASEFRHDLLHGFALDHTEGASEVEMYRLLRGDVPYARKKFTVSTAQILEQAGLAVKLGGRAIKLALGLQKLITMASEK